MENIDLIDEKIAQLHIERKNYLLKSKKTTKEIEKQILLQKSESCLKQIEVLVWVVNFVINPI